MLDPATILEIHQLLALYGHIIDEKDLSRLDEIYTPDGIFDLSSMGFPVAKGIDSIRDFLDIMHVQQRLDGVPNPLAHHATNIVVTEDSPGLCQVLSKGIEFRGTENPKINSIVYRDIVKKTPAGWRFVRRTASRLGFVDPAK
jgi:hypothetical protein